MHKISREFCVWIALALVAVTLPFPQLKINTWCIWLLIICWLFANSLQDKLAFLKSRKQIWLFVAVFFIYAIGIIYGNFRIGLFEIEKKLALLIFPIVLGTLPKINANHYRLILASYAASCILIGLLCLVSVFYINYSRGIKYSSESSWLFSYTNLTETYGFHPSYFAMYCILSLSILVNILLKGNNSIIRKAILMTGALFLIVFVFLLASRIGLFALFILFISFIIGYSYKKKRLLYGILALTFILIAGIYALQVFTPLATKLKGLFDTASENPIYSGSFRIELWKSTCQVIQDNPLTGVGTGDLQATLDKIYETIKSPNKEYYNYKVYNSHNQFLDVAATVGILALLLFVWSLVYPAYKAYKRVDYLYVIFAFLFVILSREL